MIVVDTSALMAILLDEAAAEFCVSVLAGDDQLLISAGTMAEALIVGARRQVGDEMAALIGGLGLDIVAVTAASARLAAQAYEKWGKSIHPASLNFGDCFSYALANENGCPLLFVGNDFSQTDIVSAASG